MIREPLYSSVTFTEARECHQSKGKACRVRINHTAKWSALRPLFSAVYRLLDVVETSYQIVYQAHGILVVELKVKTETQRASIKEQNCNNSILQILQSQ